MRHKRNYQLESKRREDTPWSRVLAQYIGRANHCRTLVAIAAASDRRDGERMSFRGKDIVALVQKILLVVRRKV